MHFVSSFLYFINFLSLLPSLPSFPYLPCPFALFLSLIHCI